MMSVMSIWILSKVPSTTIFTSLRIKPLTSSRKKNLRIIWDMHKIDSNCINILFNHSLFHTIWDISQIMKLAEAFSEFKAIN